jgi:hypothetical protein
MTYTSAAAVEYRHRLQNGDGSVCRKRAQGRLYRLIKAAEGPSRIVQNATTICDNPARSRVQWTIEAQATGAKLKSTSAPKLSHRRRDHTTP